MPVELPCPKCGNVATVAEESLGRRGRCRKCGEVFALARPGGGTASGISGDASAWKGSSAASPTDLPEQFGRYRIMKLLGQGGMGAVYLAHDTELDRRVALKVPFFGPAYGPQAIQRFRREARAAATLEHPNLCPIFDVGEVDGHHYFTMPYIEGKPLSEAIPKGQAVPEAQAAALTRKLALALQEAHAQGVVHRDLKPGNIMVNRRRELVIMDFGLARMLGGEEALTRTGNVLGTALYMAPEQAAGDVAAIGPASDVYSLGVILYELLTGCRPFEGPWSLVIGLKTVKDPDPPSTCRPSLDPALDIICLKAIARKLDDRYSTMAEFAEALNAYLERASGPASARMGGGATSSTGNPESLATKALSGLVTGENSPPNDVIPERPVPGNISRERPWLPNRARIIAAAGVTSLLGMIVYLMARREPLAGPERAIEIPTKEAARPGPAVASNGAQEQGRSTSIVGLWDHQANDLNGEIEFRSDGTVINARRGIFGRWALVDSKLTIRWPNTRAPGGTWIDQVELAPDGSSYAGTNQKGVPIRGTRIVRDATGPADPSNGP